MNAEKWRERIKNWSNHQCKVGNTTYNVFVGPIAERYEYDFKLCQESDGWKQYDTDQDASYFGIWVHLEGRLVITFAEGDLSVVCCEDDAHLKAQLDSMAEFYGEPPPAFRVIDADGQQTHYFDERPTVGDGNAEDEKGTDT